MTLNQEEVLLASKSEEFVHWIAFCNLLIPAAINYFTVAEDLSSQAYLILVHRRRRQSTMLATNITAIHDHLSYIVPQTFNQFCVTNHTPSFLP